MAETDLELANQAIGLAGGEPIADFNDDTPVSSYAALQWPRRKAFLLGQYRWVFAARIAQLEQLAVKPASSPFDFAFKPPADLAGAVHAYRNSPDRLSAQEVPAVMLADFIAAPCTPLWAEYTSTAGADAWPPWFRELAVRAFAADVARRMLRQTTAAQFEQEAFGTPEMNLQGGLMLAAMQADSRNAEPRSLCYPDGGALVAARYGVGVALGAGGGLAGFPNNGFPFVVEVTGA